MTSTPEYLARFFGGKAVERIDWIRAADYTNTINRELFPYWQQNALLYTRAAAREALTVLDSRSCSD